MYTGKTGKPCCLCGREETDARLDLPPLALPEMDNAGPIAWRDVEGEVSLHFCADDWETVRDLVLDTGLSPLPRCNAAHADFDLREDFEALLNDRRDEPDHAAVEERLLARAADANGDPEATDRERVQAWIVRQLLVDDGGTMTDASAKSAGEETGTGR